MGDTPINVQRHITLVVEDTLSKEQIKSWLDCVRTSSPAGVTSTIQSTDNEGRPRAVKLIHRSMKDKESYVVPLSRDLLPREVDRIAACFVEANPDLNFDIETNASFSVSMERPDFTKDDEKHIALSNILAKNKHDEWMKEKIDGGWRYGNEVSLNDKTHPLLLPWEQLPDKYKKPDLDAPSKMISLLNDQGYAVLPKDSLDAILNLLKKIT